MTQTALTIAMAALVSQAAACVIHVDDRDREHGGGGGGGSDLATISARWSLRNMVDGATTRCPVGFDTVELFAQPVDANGDALDDPSIDIFDCNAREGLSTDLSPELYRVWIEVRSRDLAGLYAQSLSQMFDVRQADAQFSTDILNDGGYFQLSWDLIGKTTNRPIECSQAVGLDSILAVSTSVADARRIYDDRRPCADHAGVSEGLLQGSYTITMDAMAGDKSLGKATTLTGKLIGGQNRITDLGHVVVPIDGL
jgi:hypothetical protein